MLVWIVFAFVLINNALCGNMLADGVDLFIYIGLCIVMLGYVLLNFYSRAKHGSDPLQELDEINKIMDEEEKVLDESDYDN